MKWNLIATEWRIGGDKAGIKISDRGNGKWAVYDGGLVLNKDGRWEHEPLPSGRADAFIEHTRHDSPTAALLAYRKFCEEETE